MSTFNTRCPSCNGVNRVPSERISESPTCGKCKTALLDGAPIEGTSLNFQSILNSSQPVVVDFWATWCNPCFVDAVESRKKLSIESKGILYIN